MCEVTRHETDITGPMHWTEFWNGLDKIESRNTPACEPGSREESGLVLSFTSRYLSVNLAEKSATLNNSVSDIGVERNPISILHSNRGVWVLVEENLHLISKCVQALYKILTACPKISRHHYRKVRSNIAGSEKREQGLPVEAHNILIGYFCEWLKSFLQLCLASLKPSKLACGLLYRAPLLGFHVVVSLFFRQVDLLLDSDVRNCCGKNGTCSADDGSQKSRVYTPILNAIQPKCGDGRQPGENKQHKKQQSKIIHLASLPWFPSFVEGRL